MIVNFVITLSPGFSRVSKVADQFLFLAVDADDRILLIFKSLSHFSNDLKLPVSIRMIRLGDTLSIRFQRKFIIFQDASHAARTCKNTIVFQLLAQSVSTSS